MALATVCTLVDVCSEAAATTAAWRLVSDARQSADEFADLGLERAGEIVEHAGAPHLDFVFGFLFRVEALGLYHVVLEHLDGGGHRADLVAARSAFDVAGEIAAGEARHPGREVDDRLADAAAHHHHQAGAGDRDRNKSRERDQEAEARRRIGGAKDLFGVVVEGFAHLDDGAESALRLHKIGVEIVLVFAAERAVLHQFQLFAEAVDIGIVHLAERGCDIRRRRGIAA